jgi:hypothetical protein
MPYGALLLALNVICIVHAAKTGRFWPWAYVIFLLPGFGVAAYVLVELAPSWFRGQVGVAARRGIDSRLNRNRTYKLLKDRLEVLDTVTNRHALADECLRLGLHQDALDLIESILAMPLGREPVIMLAKARCQYGLGDMPAALATLDGLKREWPDYRPRDGRLLYACALEGLGRSGEALAEYDVLVTYDHSPEAQMRRAMLLANMGRTEQARRQAESLLIAMRQGPRYLRKTQAEWIRIAERIAAKAK